jgi:carbamoyl-phosphate synthase large subunit
MTFNVLITGAGSVMGQSIYKALAKSDYAGDINVYVTNSLELGAAFNFSQEPFSSFKFQENIICPYANDVKYLPFIESLVKEKNIDIIYPGTQHELMVLSAYKEKNDIIACPPLDVVEKCMDKASTTEVLNMAGIAGPDTIRVSNGVVEGDPVFPVILKPNSSSASRNVFKCNNAAELDRALSDYHSLNIHSAVVQGYLEGPEITCGVYLDKYSGEVSYLSFDRVLSEDGASLYGEVIANADIDDYLKKVCVAFKSHADFQYGHINVQLRLTCEGPFLFEINGRLSSTEAPKAELGFNSVEAYFYNIVLKKTYHNFSPKVGRKFIRYYEEIYF